GEAAETVVFIGGPDAVAPSERAGDRIRFREAAALIDLSIDFIVTHQRIVGVLRIHVTRRAEAPVAPRVIETEGIPLMFKGKTGQRPRLKGIELPAEPLLGG